MSALNLVAGNCQNREHGEESKSHESPVKILRAVYLCILIVSRCLTWSEHNNHGIYNYHPQTKFAKVMFSQVSVCPGGVCLLSWEGVCHTPLGRHLLGRYPRADTPSAYWDTLPPPVQCMLRNGQQVGGMHPTGMYSCLLHDFKNYWLWNQEFCNLRVSLNQSNDFIYLLQGDAIPDDHSNISFSCPTSVSLSVGSSD